MAAADAPSPELLYLLSGDEDDFLEASRDMQPADIAEALSQLPPEGAARVVRALPFHLAVQVFDEPELEDRGGIIAQLPNEFLGPIIGAMSSDNQVGLVRELNPADRERLAHLLDAPTRDTLRQLLAYPATSAGGIMTTEFVSVPASWTAVQVRRYISEVGSAKETVYAIYVVGEKDQRLLHVISLREVVMADSDTGVLDIGERRKAVTTRPFTDREDVARLISKYNLLAIPVVDDGNHILGIVTVDDIIDALVSETTEDVQKFGGMEALNEPYMEISLGKMIQKRAGWLCALFLGEMLTATAMGHFEHEISQAVVLALVHPPDHQLGRQLGLPGHLAHHPCPGAPGSHGPRLVAGGHPGTALRPDPGHDPRDDRHGPHRSLAAPRLVRLRDPLPPGRDHRLARAGGGRPLRLPDRLDAALPAAPDRIRPGERLGPVRRHAGRRDRAGHLLLGRPDRAARNPPVTTPAAGPRAGRAGARLGRFPRNLLRPPRGV